MEVLKIKNFRYYLASKIISEVGNGLHSTAVMLLLYKLTQSATKVSVAMIMFMLPYLLFSAYAGVLSDRKSAKRIMMISDLVRVPLVLTIPYITNYYFILVVIFIHSTISSLYAPAESSLLPKIVDKQSLLGANSLLSLSRSVPNFILGASISGILFQAFGENIAFYMNALSFFLSFVLLLGIKGEPTAPAIESSEKKVFDGFKEGLDAINGNSSAKLFIVVMLVFGFTNSAINLNLLAFTSEVVKSNALYGFLIASNGVGSIVGAILINKMARFEATKFLILLVFISGVVNAVFPVLSYMTLFMLAYVVMGLIDASINIMIRTHLHKTIPEQLMGTVFGMINTVTSITPFVSMLISGLVIDRIGPIRVYYIVGIIKILMIVPITYYFMVSKKNLKTKKVT